MSISRLYGYFEQNYNEIENIRNRISCNSTSNIKSNKPLCSAPTSQNYLLSENRHRSLQSEQYNG